MKSLLFWIALLCLFVYLGNCQDELEDYDFEYTDEDNDNDDMGFDDDEDSDIDIETKYANLIAHKTGDLETILDKEYTITITIFNVGESAAYDVNVEDQEWPEHVLVAEGATQKTFPKIEPQGSVSMDYVIVPTEQNPLFVAPAKITYQATEDHEEEDVLYSTDLPKIKVLSEQQYQKRYGNHLFEWGKFVLLCFVIIGFPAYLHVNTNKSVSDYKQKGEDEKRKRRKKKKKKR